MKNNSFFSFKFPDKVLGIDKYFLNLFLPPIGLIILFFISLNLIVIPKLDEITTIKNKTVTVESSTARIEEQITYLQSVDQEELQKNAEYLDNAVLKDNKSYLLVGIIREVAKKYDFQVESFSLIPGELKNTGVGITKTALDSLTKMPVSLIIAGPKDKGLELILALEKTLPILFIDKFETETTGDVLKFGLVVYSYYTNAQMDTDTNSVVLSDLILSKDESSLLTKISSFSKINENEVEASASGYQTYERGNPFSL